jgi:Zn finger protein HypA/HybF involved in hydrogenase expression
MNLKWDCEECEHEWSDSPFVTYIECPECGSEEIGHY